MIIAKHSFSQADSLIFFVSFKDDVIVVLLLNVSFMVFVIQSLLAGKEVSKKIGLYRTNLLYWPFEDRAVFLGLSPHFDLIENKGNFS